MNDTLRSQLELQIENEAVVRKAARLEFDEVSKLAALIITSRGVHADEGRIRECRAILKKHAGILSNWRGVMETVVLAKMSLADDPEAYLEGVQAVYQQLTANKVFRSEYQAMCAMTIYDLCPQDQIATVVERTLAQYERARELHPILTDQSDLTLIALMVLTGADVDEASGRAEECLELLKPLFKFHADTKQMTSHVLALSDKPAQEKVDYFWALYQDLVASKHNMSRSFMIAILAAFVDIDVPRSQIVAEIGEADDFLKGKKGYGPLGVGSKFRRLMAAVMVLESHQNEAETGRSNAIGTAIAEVVAEQIVQTIIMIVIVSSIQASQNSNSN